LRATAEPSLGPTPTTAAMPLEEVDPDTDLSICVSQMWRERERKAGSSYLARQPAVSCVRF
jgi:hypothetical protein